MHLSRRWYLGILATALVALLLLGVPPLLPGSVSISSVQIGQNPLIPLTSNPGFESGYSSWSVHAQKGSAISIVLGTAFNGSSHSLFISAGPNDTASSISYVGNQTLPIDLNSSIVFSMAVKDNGGSPLGDVSALDVVLNVSYQDRHPIIVFVALGNISIPSGETLILPNQLGFEMIRSMQPGSQWQQFVLQLGGARMLQQYEHTLYSYYGINASGSQPSDYFLTGLFIHPDNINCYVDDVGIFTARPAPIQVTVSKLSPLPSTLLVKGVYLNSTRVQASSSYGFLSDSYTFDVFYPMVKGVTFVVETTTIMGWSSVRVVEISGGPTAI